MACRGQRHFADLVEHDGALTGQLELSDLAAEGAGEGALFMAEEFALGQVFGQRGAVYGHVRRLGVQAAAVNVGGQQFLARTALALDHYRGVAGRDIGRRFEQGRQVRVAGDDLLFARRRRLGPPGPTSVAPPAGQRLFHGQDQGFHGKGLEQVVAGALLHGLGRVADTAVPGDHQHRKVRRPTLQPVQQFDSGHAGHSHIGDDQACTGGCQLPEGRVSIGGLQDIESPALQAFGDKAPDLGVVIYDQDRTCLH